MDYTLEESDFRLGMAYVTSLSARLKSTCDNNSQRLIATSREATIIPIRDFLAFEVLNLEIPWGPSALRRRQCDWFESISFWHGLKMAGFRIVPR